jgi:multidrug efflux pump
VNPNRTNLSEWALTHQPFVLFLLLALALIGVISYSNLAQSEDTPFTIKVMVVSAVWPGASAKEMEQQVTDRLEKALEETPHLNYLRSYSKPGESVVFVMLKDSTLPKDVPPVWYQVRKKIGDMRHTLPQGVVGPFFNDDFGAVYGNIYTLSGEGYSHAQLRDYADTVRNELRRIADVDRVELFGKQEEKIFIDLSNSKIATLGLDLNSIISTIQQQNTKLPTSAFETASDKIYLRASQEYTSLESLRATPLRAANGRSLRLGDIAEIYRGYQQPPAPIMRRQGQEVVAIGVSMVDEGDVIELGRNLDREIGRIRKELPVGLELHQTSNMPKVVGDSVWLFMQTLIEAVVIVLLVSFFSLGWRPGLVVALTIPFVLAATFLFMDMFNIGLHKMTFGALILSLGLLVDDAIIAVEMMAVKMEQGMDRIKAAAYAYDTTALPMLSGTLVTAAGFLPIATAASSASEYARVLFEVTTIALLVSWVAAVIFVPYLGYKMLPDPKPHTADAAGHTDEEQIYRKPFYQRFRVMVLWCMRHRWLTVGATLVTLVISLIAFGQVQQQFFPPSTRPVLIVDMWLPEGSSIAASDKEVKKLEAWLMQQKGIEFFVSHVGSGSPRFSLTQDQELQQNNFGQFIINTQDVDEREALRAKLIKLFAEDFPQVRSAVNRLSNGPPVGFPVLFRVSGPDIREVRRISHEVAAKMRENPHLSNVQLNWEEPSKVVRLEIDMDKARLLGLASVDLLHNSLNGFGITHYREGDQQIEVLLRSLPEERADLSALGDLMVATRVGKSVPLSQIAKIHYDFEEGVIWRRNRQPTIDVRANLYGDIQAPVVSKQVLPTLEPIRAKLPFGYHLETGGAIEESDHNSQSVAKGFPLFGLVVITVLMLQLRSFSRTALVLLTAPLGLIGTSIFMLALNQPFGFIAMLGTVALSGMIMRNSIILVDQIEQDETAGKHAWDAVIDSTIRRFRPIVLTALAAILAMIPLTHSTYFAPMAVAIMGGLLVATLLTLLFLPALYVAWYRVPEPRRTS